MIKLPEISAENAENAENTDASENTEDSENIPSEETGVIHPDTAEPSDKPDTAADTVLAELLAKRTALDPTSEEYAEQNRELEAYITNATGYQKIGSAYFQLSAVKASFICGLSIKKLPSVRSARQKLSRSVVYSSPSLI